MELYYKRAVNAMLERRRDVSACESKGWLCRVGQRCTVTGNSERGEGTHGPQRAGARGIALTGRKRCDQRRSESGGKGEERRAKAQKAEQTAWNGRWCESKVAGGDVAAAQQSRHDRAETQTRAPAGGLRARLAERAVYRGVEGGKENDEAVAEEPD